jgi:hypothetical protein
MGPSDQIAFDAVLREDEEIVFLRSWPNTPSPEIILSSVRNDINEVGKILIARIGDVNNLTFNKIRNRDVYSCNESVELVVEFSRCYVGDKFIRAGRFFRVDRFWNADDKLECKSKEFTTWADALYRRAKKSLLKIEQFHYAGAEALEMRKAGIAFEGLDIPLGAMQSRKMHN